MKKKTYKQLASENAKRIEQEAYDKCDDKRIFYTGKYGELRAYERWQLRLMLKDAFVQGVLCHSRRAKAKK